MPFLTKAQLDDRLVKQAAAQYKAQLRASLQSPALTAEQRQAIRDELAQVGKPKTYDETKPPKPGAIQI